MDFVSSDFTPSVRQGADSNGSSKDPLIKVLYCAVKTNFLLCALP